MHLLRVFIFGLLVACGGSSSSTTRAPSQPSETVQPPDEQPDEVTSPTKPTEPTQPTEAARLFERIVVIVFENTDAARAMAEPYFAQLASRGALLSEYYALTHPSYPNYLAMIAGTTFDVGDDIQRTFDARSVGDLLVDEGMAWKVYAEDYPGNCFLGESQGLYWRKHVPFLSLRGVQESAECNRVVNSAQWATDVEAGALPEFSLVIPNNLNNGHDAGIGYGNAWLKEFLDPLLADAKFMKGTLIVVTFDENATWDAPNRIYTVFLGPMVRVGAVSNVHYDHYSLLRTIEDNFELGTLEKNDDNAQPISDVWVK